MAIKGKRSPLKVNKDTALVALIELHADTVNDVRFETARYMQLEAAALEIAIRTVRDHYVE